MCDIFGIIEQGQLLAVRTIDELQHADADDVSGYAVPETVVVVRVLGADAGRRPMVGSAR